MKVTDNLLKQLEECLNTGIYKELETDKIELKDLSGGDDWKELYKSVCAFLNTQGGIIIIGVKEKSDKSAYQFQGFNLSDSEAKLKELPKQFTSDNGQQLDLTEYIRPDLYEIRDFMTGRICIVYIEKLPEDKKFVMYNGNAYERKLTGDHKITKDDVARQKEIRVEIETVRELRNVQNATLEDLDIDKLNDFIQRLNQGMKVETLKPDIQAAQSFLAGKKFVLNGMPTFLGMLVCGRHIYDFVESRCQVDCFVTSEIQIATNKKIFKDNIIPLLESSIGFVFSNIATGISSAKGGTTVFEYPERLIRETVNNALAHRDYSINKFVNITIHPNKQIEIRNPGKFRHEQIMHIIGEIPIRRIIPIPKAQNPRLADVLKTFDRWEGKGWGMSSLTNMALENQIDLPYYILYAEQDVGLIIPKGKVLDNEMDWWIKSFEGYIFKKTNGRELNEEQLTALAYFFKSERINKAERYTIALTPDNNHFSVIADMETWGLIQKHPDSPRLYPVYIVDRTLTRFDFIDELRTLYGGGYDNLKNEFKEVLNVIYHFNQFGRSIKVPSASQVGNFLFFRKYQVVTDVEVFNEFKRKIRRIVNTLTNNQYLIKSGEGPKTSHIVNPNFKRTNSLFD